MRSGHSTWGVTFVWRLSCPTYTSRLGEQWEQWSIKLLINRDLSFSYSRLRNPLHSWRSTSFSNWASCPHYCKARGGCWSLLWKLREGRASIIRPEDLTLRLLMGSCLYSVTRMINILPNTLSNLTRPATSHSQGNGLESSVLLPVYDGLTRWRFAVKHNRLHVWLHFSEHRLSAVCAMTHVQLKVHLNSKTERYTLKPLKFRHMLLSPISWFEQTFKNDLIGVAQCEVNFDINNISDQM